MMNKPRTPALRRLTRVIRAFQRDERGVSAIEFAFVSTFLLLFLLPIADYGLFALRKMEVTGAVRAGAQYALVNTAYIPAATMQSNIEAVVTNATNLVLTPTVDTAVCGCSDGTAIVCTGTCGMGTTGRTHHYTTISADYTYAWFILPNADDTITAFASVRTQ